MKIVSKIASWFTPSGRAQRTAERDAQHAATMAMHRVSLAATERAELRMRATWEAAEKGGIRGENWLTSKLSVTSAMESEVVALWDRAEDLAKNDTYGSSAVAGRVDNVIGTGVTFHSRIRAQHARLSDAQARSINEQRETIFREWAKKDKFKKKQRLFERSKATFGEGIGVMSDIGTDDGRPIPLTWQIINPRRLETPPKHAGNNLVRLGVQFTDDTYTTVKGYWIKDVEQDDTRNVGVDYTFYDAWRVTHSFDETTPGQIRGFPWLAPAMATLKDIKDYGEAKLIAEQVSACTTTFISCDNPHGRAEGAATGFDSAGNRLSELSPGTVEYIGLDDKVHHIDPNRPGNSYAPFIEHKLMQISAALRYPYALLSKDFRKASFANGRLEMADGRQSFECWQQAIIEDALEPVINRATHEMITLGLIDGLDARTYLAGIVVFNAHQLKPTRWKMAVNPKQEADADVAEVAADFASATDKCDERGHDFEDVLSAKEREAIARLESQARIAKKRTELGLDVEPEKTPEETKPDDESETESQDDDDEE